MTDMSSSVNLCGLVQARCACLHPADHSGPHLCACGGSWDFDADGEFVIVEIPGSASGGRIDRLIAAGVDPIVAMMLARGPITAERGGIRFIRPPDSDPDLHISVD